MFQSLTYKRAFIPISSLSRSLPFQRFRKEKSEMMNRAAVQEARFPQTTLVKPVFYPFLRNSTFFNIPPLRNHLPFSTRVSQPLHCIQHENSESRVAIFTAMFSWQGLELLVCVRKQVLTCRRTVWWAHIPRIPHGLHYFHWFGEEDVTLFKTPTFPFLLISKPFLQFTGISKRDSIDRRSMFSMLPPTSAVSADPRCNLQDNIGFRIPYGRHGSGCVAESRHSLVELMGQL